MLKLMNSLCHKAYKTPGIRRYSALSFYVPQAASLPCSSRDLYEFYQPFIANSEHPQSVYPRSFLEARIADRRNGRLMRHERLGKVLENENSVFGGLLKKRINRLQSFVGTDRKLSSKEALVILCGLSDSNVRIVSEASGEENTGSVYNSWQLAKIGRGIYELTKDSLLIFSDLQYLSTSSTELQVLLEQISDEDVVIPTFMKNNFLYDAVVPFRGASRSITADEAENKVSRLAQIRDATSVGTFYTMIGLLAIKFGKEHTVEQFLVPKVFNGSSGIIKIITDQMNQRQRT